MESSEVGDFTFYGLRDDSYGWWIWMNEFCVCYVKFWKCDFNVMMYASQDGFYHI